MQSGLLGETTREPYRGAHRVAHTEVEAALLVHGVVQARELRQRGPVVVEGVITQTVVGAGSGDNRSGTHTHFLTLLAELLMVTSIK